MPLNINEYQINDFNIRQIYYDAPIQDGLVLHLDAGLFNTITGDTWYDLSGQNNHGTLVSGSSFNSDFGGVIELDGSTGYVDVPSPNLDTQDHTVLAITRHKPNPSSKGRIMSGFNNNWILGHHGGSNKDYFSVGWVYQTGLADGTEDEWALYTGVGEYSTDTWTFYYNLDQLASNSSGSFGPNGFSIGRNKGGDSEYSDCQVGVVLAYDRILTFNEIEIIYNIFKERFNL